MPMSGSSKTLYSVLAYPTSSDIQFVIQTFENHGGSCMWILHDRDTKKDGTKIDDHFHIAVGWSKRAPDWDAFTQILDETGHGVGNHGALCPSKFRQPYDPETARVKSSVEQLKDYFLHRDSKSRTQGKYEYPETDLHFTDKWDGSSYQTYTQKRANARSIREDEKIEKVADCSALFQIIREQEFTEYCTLVDFLQSQKPDLLAGLITNAYAVKSYLDSLRGFNATGADERARRLVSQIKRQNITIRALERTIEEMQDEYKTLQEEYAQEVQALRCMYEETTGETVPDYATMAELRGMRVSNNTPAEIGRRKKAIQ